MDWGKLFRIFEINILYKQVYVFSDTQWTFTKGEQRIMYRQQV